MHYSKYRLFPATKVRKTWGGEKVEKLLSIKWLRFLSEIPIQGQSCPRSLNRTSSTVVKLSIKETEGSGGIKSRAKKEIPYKKSRWFESYFWERLILARLFFFFVATKWLLCNIVILTCIYIFDGERSGTRWFFGQRHNDGKFFVKTPFPAFQLFHLFPKEMSFSKLWINFSISRELETFSTAHTQPLPTKSSFAESSQDLSF